MEYPKEIYVSWGQHSSKQDSKDNRFLIAESNKDDLAPDINESETIGVYKLVKTVELTTRLLEQDQ